MDWVNQQGMRCIPSLECQQSFNKVKVEWIKAQCVMAFGFCLNKNG